jgi:hypothetical protein
MNLDITKEQAQALQQACELFAVCKSEGLFELIQTSRTDRGAREQFNHSVRAIFEDRSVPMVMDTPGLAPEAKLVHDLGRQLAAMLADKAA